MNRAFILITALSDIGDELLIIKQYNVVPFMLGSRNNGDGPSNQMFNDDISLLLL